MENTKNAKIGLLTREADAWNSSQLCKAIVKIGAEPVCFSFSDIVGRINCEPVASTRDNIDILHELDTVLVRPIGRGSLDEVIFRLDLLNKLERMGLTIINSPSAIEKAADKYYTLALLEEKKILVPPTFVSESPDQALKAFYDLGCDVVVKPLFGSRGRGICRVTDSDVAERIFRALAYNRQVIYVQKFIPHGKRDIRIFVVGNDIVAAMYRESENWKNNVSQGAKPIPFKPSDELKELAISASEKLGCRISGVDILESSEGKFICEINSQPGFRGLQSVTKINIAEKIIEFIANNLEG
jgi:RimK family alpha-L-glutamate ligase